MKMNFYKILTYLFTRIGGMFTRTHKTVVNMPTPSLLETQPVQSVPVDILKDNRMDTSKLKGVIPDSVFNELNNVIDNFGINTPLRMAHFLSQCSHESGNFKSLSENLNYSSSGLLATFGKYFKQPGLAEAYARKPEKIASHVYADRMGNGGEASGDGWRYRGRGFAQLTGKNNYAEFDKVVPDDIVSNPDLVATKYPLTSAAWFFSKNNLNSISDGGVSDAAVTKLTKRINGGTNGLADRIQKFKKYAKILGLL